jgi:hypothetical protein
MIQCHFSLKNKVKKDFVQITHFSAQLTIFQTSKQGYKDFSAQRSEKQGFSNRKIKTKNEFFVSVAGKKYNNLLGPKILRFGSSYFVHLF